MPNWTTKYTSAHLKIIAVARSGLKEEKITEEYSEQLKSLQHDDGSFPPIITFDVSGVPFCDAYYYAGRSKEFESFPSCLYDFSFKKCPEYSYITTCSRAASTALVLYALLDAGEPKDSPVIKKGVQYLLKTMKNDVMLLLLMDLQSKSFKNYEKTPPKN